MNDPESSVTRRELLRTASIVGAGALAVPLVSARASTGATLDSDPSRAKEPEGQRPMRFAPLDPQHAMILFADLQTGIIERSTTNDVMRLRRAIEALAKLARLFAMPTIVTTAPSESGAPVVTPEIGAALGTTPQHIRNTTDAFTHAPTREAIARARRRTLLISGVATEIIVQHSALSGIALGYDVQIVIDACGGLSPRTEDAALRRLTQAGVVTTSIASVAGQLAGDFTTPKGGAALGILYEMASG